MKKKTSKNHKDLFVKIPNCSLIDFCKLNTAFEIMDLANSKKLHIEVCNSKELSTIEINKIKNDDIALNNAFKNLLENLKKECAALEFEIEITF
jgi:hypothetical protein